MGNRADVAYSGRRKQHRLAAALVGSVMLVLSAFAAFARGPEMLTDLSSLRWQYRLVVIHEPADPAAAARRLKAESAALGERRVVWFLISENRLLSNYPGAMASDLGAAIRSGFELNGTEVLLIGLDGGIKHRASVLDLDALYAAIDAMPMRRNERDK